VGNGRRRAWRNGATLWACGRCGGGGRPWALDSWGLWAAFCSCFLLLHPFAPALFACSPPRWGPPAASLMVPPPAASTLPHTHGRWWTLGGPPPLPPRQPASPPCGRRRRLHGRHRPPHDAGSFRAGYPQTPSAGIGRAAGGQPGGRLCDRHHAHSASSTDAALRVVARRLTLAGRSLGGPRATTAAASEAGPAERKLRGGGGSAVPPPRPHRPRRRADQ